MSIIRYGNITIPLLSNWTDGTQIVLLRERVGNFRANIVVSSEAITAGTTLEDFLRKNITSLGQALEGFSLEDEGPATYGPLTGVKIEHTFTVEQQKLKQMQFYTIFRSKSYLFTFTDTPENFDSTKREAERIFSQIQIK